MSAEDIAERMRTGAALQQALREMEAIMRNAPVAILFTRERRIVRTNARFAEVFGYAADELIGAPARVLYRSDADYEALGREAGPLLARAKSFQTELFLRRKDGVDIWANMFAYVQNRDDPGEGTIWICEDRSSVKRTEEALKRAHAEQQLILENSVVGIAFIRHRLFQRCNRRLEEMYGWGRGELDGQPTRVPRAILDSANLIILSTDRGGHIVSCNPAAEQLLGLPAADMLGRLPTELCFDAAELDAHRQRLQQETGIASPTAMAALCARAHLGQIDEGEWTLKRADGTRFPAQVTISPLREGESQVKGFRVLFVDLDRFKNINDSLGHALGDALLKEVARRLSAALRAGDSVARLGGDEFVVVTPAVDAPEHAMTIAQKIRDCLKPGFQLGRHELFVTPSIGIALIPRDGTNAATLLRHADTAMYRAKATGRNTACFFDPAMTAATERYLRTESSLRRAIDRSEFEPYYQPVVGLELLLRWRHPELGLVGPTR